ncbi:hypothetical protein [Maridesulfovibrio sp.]|uniref:hypothetical protein n=1 Tax=Maridesulfovibrio sp. TaxID=2795000 RepID=UPI002AA64B67|nr:hypothetical protein [Maridesulfovibrio sp.]
MAYIVPLLVIGGCVGGIFWGAKKIWDRDDSADRKAAEILQEVPRHLKKYVDNISVDEHGVRFTFKKDTPQEVYDEVKREAKPLEGKLIK